MNRQALEREIAALEAKMGGRRSVARQVKSRDRSVTAREKILAEIDSLSASLKEGCGTSYMEDEAEMSYMDEGDIAEMDDDLGEVGMSYMDDGDIAEMDDDLDDDLDADLDDDLEDGFEDDLDDDLDDDLEDDFEDELDDDFHSIASEEADGVEDDITQDYLSDVAEEFADTDDIVSDESMLETAPTGYVARLKSASKRLDRVAGLLEKQGRKKLAFRIDKIADAVDARIKKEVRNG